MAPFLLEMLSAEHAAESGPTIRADAVARGHASFA